VAEEEARSDNVEARPVRGGARRKMGIKHYRTGVKGRKLGRKKIDDTSCLKSSNHKKRWT